MSVKTLAGEMQIEFEHAADRLIDKVESLGLDPAAPEVFSEIEFWFGLDMANYVADNA